ncbi:MAG: hypothetical protein AAGL17_23390, partial [Cyanobacteria bacterium J06576_12]
DLVAAGVLHDDYDPDSDLAYDFTPARSLEEIIAEDEAVSESPSMSREEALTDAHEYFRRVRMSAKFRKQAHINKNWT